MKTKTAKQAKKTKPAVQLKDIKPKTTPTGSKAVLTSLASI